MLEKTRCSLARKIVAAVKTSSASSLNSFPLFVDVNNVEEHELVSVEEKPMPNFDVVVVSGGTVACAYYDCYCSSSDVEEGDDTWLRGYTGCTRRS